MKYYDVVKVDSTSHRERRYGIMCEEYVRLVTRGYKHDKDLPQIYNRRNSKWFYIVTPASRSD